VVVALDLQQSLQLDGEGLSRSGRRARWGGFMRAVHGCRTLGFSLYDFAGTSATAWRTLAAPAAPDDSTTVCA
jgi:hypothetical protein